MDTNVSFLAVIDWLLGTPLTCYTIIISIICTYMLRGIQFRSFIESWRRTLRPAPKKSSDKKQTSDMSPLQAFVNTLSANIGNGSLGGMATAIYAGGPGAALWAVIIGFLLMSVRFAEVYISTYYGKTTAHKGLGGPMLYLQKVPGGKLLAYAYAVCLLIFGLLVGNAIQANTISLSLRTTWGINEYVIAGLLVAFVYYIMAGGAARIVRASDAIVPVKVIVFFGTSLLIVAAHYAELPQALATIWHAAFSPYAFAGGVLGYTVQQAMQYGITRSIMATESGLGTAAVLFGRTGSTDAMGNALMGMLSTFISTMVCFLVGLCIVVTGALSSGLDSTALTIAAYSSIFGMWSGWIVSFLSISFGMGVLVTFAYITREAWLFVTGGAYEKASLVMYPLATAWGALVSVKAIWHLSSVINGALLIINLFGILWLMPTIAKLVKTEEHTS